MYKIWLHKVKESFRSGVRICATLEVRKADQYYAKTK